MQIFREANRAADFMALRGHSLPIGLTIFYEPPQGLRAILEEDYRGVALSKLMF